MYREKKINAGLTTVLQALERYSFGRVRILSFANYGNLFRSCRLCMFFLATVNLWSTLTPCQRVEGKIAI